jgi:hypothetical protein
MKIMRTVKIDFFGLLYMIMLRIKKSDFSVGIFNRVKVIVGTRGSYLIDSAYIVYCEIGRRRTMFHLTYDFYYALRYVRHVRDIVDFNMAIMKILPQILSIYFEMARLDCFGGENYIARHKSCLQQMRRRTTEIEQQIIGQA